MHKILFISYDGMTDPLGQSQVIPYLTGLSQFGYQITILSCEKKERYFLLKKEIEKPLAASSIKWAPILYHKKPPVLSTIYDIYHLKRKAKQLHATEKFDLVHTRPGIPALIGLWMKNKWSVKFLNDIREFYADSRIDGGIWNQESFFYKKIYHYFKKKENEAVENSDGIVCLTYAAKKIIASWPCYKKDIPLQVIPCSVDMKLFDPLKTDAEQKLKFKKELSINDEDFVISYLGSIGSWYLTDELMKFFKIIDNTISNAKFLFISPQHSEIIYDTATKFGLAKNKIIVKHGNRNEVPVLLSFSKYAVFFIKPCYSKLSSSPTKHGEIMAMGIPVVSNAGVGDVKEIIEKYASGIVIDQLNEKEFNAIADALPNQNHFDSNRIRQGAKEFYNLEDAVNKYRLMYHSILD